MNNNEIKNNNLETILTIENDGVEIKSTNYWNTVFSESGLYFLSANAGSLRMLVPSGNRPKVVEHLKEISNTKLATIEASVVKKEHWIWSLRTVLTTLFFSASSLNKH